MQIDMHFYGLYALARAAGVKPDPALVIATASQFVDDAIDDEAIVLANHRGVIPTMTSHKPLDWQNCLPGDQWKVWVPFHFLPGNQPEGGSFTEKMVCRKNSAPARRMMENALSLAGEPLGPVMVGIACHVYADTFAHYGFIGLKRDWNRVRNDTVEINVRSKKIIDYIEAKFEDFKARLIGSAGEVMPVGHAAVATYPDRPYLVWRYAHENGQVVKRNNPADYLEACQELFNFFARLCKQYPAYGRSRTAKWADIKGHVKRIINKEAAKQERINAWRQAIKSGRLFSATAKDKALQYDQRLFKSASISYFFADHGQLDGCPGYLFHRAAWKHRNLVLHHLLPEFGIVV